jgi:hypothetical protein
VTDKYIDALSIQKQNGGTSGSTETVAYIYGVKGRSTVQSSICGSHVPLLSHAAS